ncbi:Reverse transcriptase, RNA-dependent DNA polymerase [Corchorus capsularis]|uniref:Reverse transcriptase, RNA-dependent DNA polymerase n=1 Tax=Corchorus capsularis TaxID=210143 RepID=A0A1R3K851_COCAP|nr:Reverse transcriptase, RNA-dependent DNA polymerase [Corchorus capsularis]
MVSLQQSSSNTASVSEVPSTSLPSEVIPSLDSSTATPSVAPIQDQLPSSSMPSQSLPVTDISQGRNSVPRPVGNTHSMQTRAKNNIFKKKTVSIATKYPYSSSIEPTCVSQALKDEKWCVAMSEEINALLRNNTWELVPKSDAQNLVGCKWVFRIKRNPDGSVSRYKARLVAKGFNQRPGIDYTGTFSPVVKPTTIRLILTIALQQKWKLFQLDVNNAFLHGTLDEDVFMKQPPGFVDSSTPQLYDIIITGSDLRFVTKFVADLSARFSLKELLPLHYFLGIEIVAVKDGLFLSQRKYIVDLLQRTNMHDSKAVTTPMASTVSLTVDDSETLSDPTEYRSIKMVARSSTEAEYRVIANAAAELSWLQNILQELHVSTKQVPLILCDNVGATYVSMNPALHSKMKHISIDFHFVRDKVNTGQLTIRHVPIHDQLADLLTKPLPRSKFLHLVSKIGVLPGDSILSGRIEG